MSYNTTNRGYLSQVDTPSRVFAPRVAHALLRAASPLMATHGAYANPLFEIGDNFGGQRLARRHFQIRIVVPQSSDQQAGIGISRGAIGGPELPPLRSRSRLSSCNPPWILGAEAL